MEYFCVGIQLLLVATAASAQTTKACHDIDTDACKLMLVSKPDLCSDPVTSTSVCPRFCNLCPVECYHCNGVVQDYHLCNTTMLCAEGQVCMKKELKSFVDGHHEYELTCEEKKLCDGGSDLHLAIGKRGIKSRDISVTCCTGDLCNYPGAQQVATQQPTTANCPKDIIFLVDETSNVAKTQQAGVINLISEVSNRLDIGTSANLVALYGYAHDIDKKFSLTHYTDKQSLLAGIQSVSLNTHDRSADIHDTIQALVGHVLQPRAGDRQSYPDAIVIIDDSYHTRVSLTNADIHALQKASQNIIHVNVGRHINLFSGSPIDGLATDANHVIKVSDLYTPTSLVDSIVALLGQC